MLYLCVSCRNTSHVTHLKCVCKTKNFFLPCLRLFTRRCACVGLLVARLQFREAGSAYFKWLSDSALIAWFGATIFFKCPKHYVRCRVSVFRQLIVYFDFGITRILRFWKAQSVMFGPDVKTSRDAMLWTCHFHKFLFAVFYTYFQAS